MGRRPAELEHAQVRGIGARAARRILRARSGDDLDGVPVARRAQQRRVVVGGRRGVVGAEPGASDVRGAMGDGLTGRNRSDSMDRFGKLFTSTAG
jgi:hypothetical protein